MSTTEYEDIIITPGGPPDPGPVADAPASPPAGAGLAATLNAGLAKLERDSRRTFDLPGWVDGDGEPTLRLRASSQVDEEARQEASTPARTIALVTEAVELRDGEEWRAVEHGWRGVAVLMGRPEATTTEVIGRVLDNGARLQDFSSEIVAWMVGDFTVVQRALGD